MKPIVPTPKPTSSDLRKREQIKKYCGSHKDDCHTANGKPCAFFGNALCQQYKEETGNDLDKRLAKIRKAKGK